MADGFETELKFTLRPADLDTVRAALLDRDVAAGPAVIRTVVSSYLDTGDHRLRAAGLSLRLRRVDGRAEQTLKEGSGLVRGETTVRAPGGEPDLAAFARDRLRRRAKAAIGRRPLAVIFTVAVQRTTVEVRTPTGDRIEVALDDGHVDAGPGRASVCELELELKAGEPLALFDLARRILAGVPARPSPMSKAEYGYRLLAGAGAPTVARVVEPQLAADVTVAGAAVAVLRSAAGQVFANLAVVEASDAPEGPHQLRVGLRRLRTALRVFRPVLDPDLRERVDRGARDLGREVGRMRDLDVLSTDVVGVCAGHVDTTDLSALLDDRRTAERGVLLAVLASDPVSDLLIDLVALSAGLGLDRAAAAARRRLDQPAAPFAHAAIRRLWRRTARRGRDPDSLSEDARHDLRKAFKALRYALDDLGSLLGRKDLKHRLRDIRGAQEVLGYLNDVRNAESLVSLTAEEEARSGVRPAASVDRAVGFCLGWHRAEAARAWARARRRVSLDPDAA